MNHTNSEEPPTDEFEGDILEVSLRREVREQPRRQSNLERLGILEMKEGERPLS